METSNPIIALIALTSMEIVLGIDNIVFIAILSARLPKSQQVHARRLGIGLALASRLLLLFTVKWILGLKDTVFELTSLGIPEDWFSPEVNEVSWKDIILFSGGLFLIWKSVHEIHRKLEGSGEGKHKIGDVTFASVISQIVLLDVIFSLDSVMTAVGMADQLWIMVTAVVIAVVVMLIFAEKVSNFVQRHPTVKMLALSFLILIGVMLVAEGSGTEIDKNYIYFAMAFALIVELLNMRMRVKTVS